jgi:hypothetical protein
LWVHKRLKIVSFKTLDEKWQPPMPRIVEEPDLVYCEEVGTTLRKGAWLCHVCSKFGRCAVYMPAASELRGNLEGEVKTYCERFGIRHLYHITQISSAK